MINGLIWFGILKNYLNHPRLKKRLINEETTNYAAGENEIARPERKPLLIN